MSQSCQLYCVGAVRIYSCMWCSCSVWPLCDILLDVSFESVEGCSVAGLDLDPSSNLLLPLIRLCRLIGSMWCFVMSTELSLTFVRVPVCVCVCVLRTMWFRIQLSKQQQQKHFIQLAKSVIISYIVLF